MAVLSSRCFSVPPRIIFSMILQDTEVRLTGCRYQARLSCPSWKLWQCLPASSQQGPFQIPKTVKKPLREVLEWLRQVFEYHGMNPVRPHQLTEMQLEQQIPQVQGWMSVYHSCSHCPAAWGPPEPVISVDDWGRERIWYLCSLSLFVRWPSSSSKRPMFFLVCPLPLMYFKNTKLDIQPLKLFFFLAFFLFTSWPEFS